MSKIVVFPAFEQPQACGDFLTKLCWFLSPAAESITSISLFAPFDELPKTVSGSMDPEILTSESAQALLAKAKLEPPPSERTGWRESIETADIVLVWRKSKSDALPQSTGRAKVLMMDESESGARLTALVRTIDSGRQTALQRSRDAYAAFKASLNKKIGYLAGNGPSLKECLRLPHDDGHVIVCNDLIFDKEMMDALKPVAVAVADSGFYAVPTRFGGTFRAALRERMETHGLWLVVSMKDYPLYIGALPSALHDRVIALPIHNPGKLNLDLDQQFAVASFSHVLPRLALPLAASVFDTIRICGLDGVEMALANDRWSGPTATALCDHWTKADRNANVANETGLGPTYIEFTKQIEQFARAIERSGKTLEGYTSSYIPALRRRGAAEPLRPPVSIREGTETTVLSLTPDMRDRVGHFWNYEHRLTPKVEAGGLRYWIAANVEWTGQNDGEETSQQYLDCSLYTYSYSLGNKPNESPDKLQAVARDIAAEFSDTIDRALANCSGRLHVYIYVGSLDHAAILYEIALLRPRVSLHINLFWFRSADAWMPWFLDRWMWLLKAAEEDPRLTITCMTAHQRRQILARSNIALPVAAHPSPLIDDERTSALLAEEVPERNRIRIFFPSANRPEKGVGLLYEVGKKVVEEIGEQKPELIFRTSPYDRRVTPEEDPLFPYVTVLDGHIDEATFIEVLRSCHVVVLPYLPPDFADRTSGLVIDSLYAGAPTITVRGTYLAEIAQKYGCGLVVDRGSAEEMAEAVIELVDRYRDRPWDFREAAKLYYRANSWQRLANELIKASAAADAAYVELPLPESKEPAVSLLGPLPRDESRVARPLAALKICLTGKGLLPAGSELLDRRSDLPLQILSSEGKGLTIAKNERAALHARMRLQKHHPELASRMLVEALAPSAAEKASEALLAKATSYCEAANIKTTGILVAATPAYSQAATELVCRLKPKGAVIAFDDAAGSNHREAAKRLAAAGYLVLVAEDHPHLGNETEAFFLRLASYPFVSDLPWARGNLVALPGDTSLVAAKDAFLKTGSNLFHKMRLDPQDVGAEFLAYAKPLADEDLVAAARVPNDDWQLSGMEFNKTTEDGYACITETETLRFHRTFLKGEAKEGKPLTFSIELARYGRRFICLVLTDARNTVRLDAVFDLESGTLLKQNQALENVNSFAVCVPTGKTATGEPTYRAWISVERYPKSEVILAQVGMLDKWSSSRQIPGESDKGLLVRNFLIETSPSPSLFPEEREEDTQEAAQEGAKAAVTETAKEGIEETAEAADTETAKEGVKETAKAAVKAAAKAAVKEGVKETAKAAAIEGAEETAEEGSDKS